MIYDNFPKFSDSKIIIHIAFHYNEERFKYLRGVISAIETYNFKKIDIYVDTNTEIFNLDKLDLKLPDKINLRIIPHQNLQHPFLLTWQHRKNIFSLKDEYDYFMYLEDDISVSYDALEEWREDSILLFKYDKIRGFIRCEVNANNEIVSTDYLNKIRCKEIFCIDKKIFFSPKNPYQGFWVYSKKQLEKFISSKCWDDGNCDWEVRERASAGMMWNDKKKHSLMVPMSELTIPGYVYVRHLPNNYALDDNERHGTLEVGDLMPTNFYNKLCIKVKSFLCAIR